MSLEPARVKVEPGGVVTKDVVIKEEALETEVLEIENGTNNEDPYTTSGDAMPAGQWKDELILDPEVVKKETNSDSKPAPPDLINDNFKVEIEVGPECIQWPKCVPNEIQLQQEIDTGNVQHIDLQIDLPTVESNTSKEPYRCEMCFHAMENSQFCHECERRRAIIQLDNLLVLNRNTGRKLKGRRLGKKEFLICKKKNINSDPLESHEPTRTNPSYSKSKKGKYLKGNKRTKACEICKKKFKNLSALASHKQVHAEQKTYTCETCNKEYRRLGFFNTHKQSHLE